MCSSRPSPSQLPCACSTSIFFFFSSRRRHTRCLSDWSSDVCSSDLYRSGYTQDRTEYRRGTRSSDCGTEPSPNGDKHVSDQGSRPYLERSQRRRRPLLHRRRDMGGETGCGWPESPGPREAPSRTRSDSNEGQDVFLELLPGAITPDRIAHCTFLHQCSRCDRWRHP